MATVKHFEELEVWKIGRNQCADIYTVIQSGAFKNNFALIDQIDSASGSVMDCISEGFDRFTKADFRHFLVIAKGSNAEVRSPLYPAFDRGFLQEARFDMMRTQSLQSGVKLNNFITYLTKTEFKEKPA